MFYTGFADEASSDFRKQIQVTKELGWKFIESRAIGTKDLASISDAEFEDIQQLLAESGVSINCFGSRVANWTRSPRKEQDFLETKQELINAIPRMKKLGIKLIRGMSFLVPSDEQFDSPELEQIIFRKVKELVSICADNGITYGHENCMNYGGQSFRHTLKLIEAINSPAFTLIFDTGNPVFTFRRLGVPPYPLASAWEFYRNVREFISYVHIKDGTCELDKNDPSKTTNMVFTFAGEGQGDVRAIVTDLIRSGYDGGFSMEPHLGHVYHNVNGKSADDSIRMKIYVEYGKRFMKLYQDCAANIEMEKTLLGKK